MLSHKTENWIDRLKLKESAKMFGAKQVSETHEREYMEDRYDLPCVVKAFQV